MSRLVVAALVLLLTVGTLFGAAAWNRGGEIQSIVLTERELALPWWWTNDPRDARGPLRLTFEWERRGNPQEARTWLNDMKLRELGFTTGVPAGAPEAADFYNRSLPRRAWVAFEFDGPAWRAIEQRLALVRDGDRIIARASRLVPIDAAVERDLLLRRYQGQPVLVLPAVIALRYDNPPTQGPSVWGTVTALVSPAVTVPRRFHERLRPLRPSGLPPSGMPPPEPVDPRYEVVLGVGRLGAPWLQELKMED